VQLKFLEKAVRRENNEKNVAKFEQLLEVIRSKKGIIRLWDMNEYSEFLAEKELKKKDKRQKEMRKTKLQKEDYNKRLDYTSNKNIQLNSEILIQNTGKLIK
jgi:hypothetical protein